MKTPCIIPKTITPARFKAAMKKVHELDDRPYRACVAYRGGRDMIAVVNLNAGYTMYFDTCNDFINWARSI